MSASRLPTFVAEDHPEGAATQLGAVRPIVVTTLSNLLRPNQAWKKWVEVIKDVDGDWKYDFNGVALLELDKDPIAAIWTSLLYDNRDLEYIKQTLTESRLYHAADFIAVNVLLGDPVPRRPTDRLGNYEFDGHMESNSGPFHSMIHCQSCDFTSRSRLRQGQPQYDSDSRSRDLTQQYSSNNNPPSLEQRLNPLPTLHPPDPLPSPQDSPQSPPNLFPTLHPTELLPVGHRLSDGASGPLPPDGVINPASDGDTTDALYNVHHSNSTNQSQVAHSNSTNLSQVAHSNSTNQSAVCNECSIREHEIRFTSLGNAGQISLGESPSNVTCDTPPSIQPNVTSCDTQQNQASPNVSQQNTNEPHSHDSQLDVDMLNTSHNTLISSSHSSAHSATHSGIHTSSHSAAHSKTCLLNRGIDALSLHKGPVAKAVVTKPVWNDKLLNNVSKHITRPEDVLSLGLQLDLKKEQIEAIMTDHAGSITLQAFYVLTLFDSSYEPIAECDTICTPPTACDVDDTPPVGFATNDASPVGFNTPYTDEEINELKRCKLCEALSTIGKGKVINEVKL